MELQQTMAVEAEALRDRLLLSTTRGYRRTAMLCAIVCVAPALVALRPSFAALSVWEIAKAVPSLGAYMLPGTLALGASLLLLSFPRWGAIVTRALLGAVCATAWTVGFVVWAGSLSQLVSPDNAASMGPFFGLPLFGILGGLAGLAVGCELRLARPAGRLGRWLTVAAALALVAALCIPGEGVGGLPLLIVLVQLVLNVRGEGAPIVVIFCFFALLLTGLAVLTAATALRARAELSRDTTLLLRLVRGYAIAFVPGTLAIMSGAALAAGVLPVIFIGFAALMHGCLSIMVTAASALDSARRKRAARLRQG